MITTKEQLDKYRATRGLKYLVDLASRTAKIARESKKVPRTVAERAQALAEDLEELMEAQK